MVSRGARLRLCVSSSLSSELCNDRYRVSEKEICLVFFFSLRLRLRETHRILNERRALVTSSGNEDS